MFRKVIGMSPSRYAAQSGPSTGGGSAGGREEGARGKASEGPIVSRGALVLEVEPPMKPGTPQRLPSASDTEFAAFYRLYHQTMMRAIQRIVGRSHVADDLLQEASLRVFLARSRLAEVEKPEGWAYVVAMKVALTWLEKERRRRGR